MALRDWGRSAPTYRQWARERWPEREGIAVNEADCGNLLVLSVAFLHPEKELWRASVGFNERDTPRTTAEKLIGLGQLILKEMT